MYSGTKGGGRAGRSRREGSKGLRAGQKRKTIILRKAKVRIGRDKDRDKDRNRSRDKDRGAASKDSMPSIKGSVGGGVGGSVGGSVGDDTLGVCGGMVKCETCREPCNGRSMLLCDL